jgi:phage shock protein PspC (stress-responsive transcriptional regulator)
MTAESIFEEIKQALRGRPEQPIVLGVCQSIAKRFDKEVWCVRLAAIVLTLFWTFPSIAAYLICGFLMKETEQRTRGFFCGLAILVRETAEKIFAFLGGIFEPGSRAKSDNGGY